MADDSNADRNIRRGIVEGLTVIIDLGTETRIDEKFFTILALEEHMADSGSKKSVANVMYGGESLEYDDGFKLVFVTQSKLSSDESCSQPSILFELSSKALEEELLSLISYEILPEDSEMKQNAMATRATLFTRGKLLQNEILELLNESEGSMMEDENLLRVLNDSRRKTSECQHAMKVANAKIIQSSERIGWFRPITVRAVLLYNVLLKMRKTRVGYNFSLLWVICILLTVIRDDEGLLVSENVNDDEQKESSKKKKKTKHVDRTASSLAAMVHATIISRDDYLSKFKSKAAKETNTSSKNEEDDFEVKLEDKDEPEETIYQMQVKKIQKLLIC